MRFWVSGHSLKSNLNFTWSCSRSPLNYTNWEEGEPYNTSGVYNCFLLHENTQKWYTSSCYNKKFFICESVLPDTVETENVTPNSVPDEIASVTPNSASVEIPNGTPNYTDLC